MQECAKIHGQHKIKTVMIEMLMLLERMVLQKNNKDEFHYVILPDSRIYNFITKCTLKHVLKKFERFI